MTASLKPYPVYKPSGVEWLGDVPAHWEVRRLASCIDQIQSGSREQSETGPDDGIPNLGGEHIGTDGQLLLRNMRYISWQFFENLRKGVIQQGDVLLVKDGATIGKVVLVREMPYEKCSINEHVYIIRSSHNFLPAFLFYNIRSSGIQESIWQEVTGSAQPGLNSSFTKSLRVPIPPLPEQHRIAAFLDQKTADIDEAITKKQRLIELLKEQKAILINQAVTKGLNPNVPMRDSGVEWIGKVPAHWEIVRNGRLFVQRNEIGFPELPILEVSLKTGIRIRDLEDSDRKQVMSDRSMYKRAVKGDVAYNMMRMWQGAGGVAPVDGLVSPAYVVAKPLVGTESRYFDALFRTRAYMAEVDKYSRGIVKDRNRLYWEDFKQMPTPCPPPDEQVLIADAIAESTATSDEGVHRIEHQISLLQEYRTILIADVVTGKLDVREDAPRES